MTLQSPAKFASWPGTLLTRLTSAVSGSGSTFLCHVFCPRELQALHPKFTFCEMLDGHLLQEEHSGDSDWRNPLVPYNLAQGLGCAAFPSSFASELKNSPSLDSVDWVRSFRMHVSQPSVNSRTDQWSHLPASFINLEKLPFMPEARQFLN